VSTKLPKATTGFVMPVYSPVRPSVHMEQLGSHWTDFHENLSFEYLSKICREYSTFIKIWQE